jgi:hypothetical protein
VSEHSGAGFLERSVTFVNKLKLLRLVVFHDDHAILFTFLLSDDEDLLNTFSFFDLDVLDKILPKGGLNLIEIIKDFLRLNTLGQGLFGDNPYNWCLWFLHFLELGTQNFLYLLQSCLSGLD